MRTADYFVGWGWCSVLCSDMGLKRRGRKAVIISKPNSIVSCTDSWFLWHKALGFSLFFLQFSLNKLCLGCYILLFFLFVFAPPIGVIAKRDRGGHGRNCVFAVCHGFAFLTEKFEKLSPVVSCCHKPDKCKNMVIALTLRHWQSSGADNTQNQCDMTIFSLFQ